MCLGRGYRRIVGFDGVFVCLRRLLLGMREWYFGGMGRWCWLVRRAIIARNLFYSGFIVVGATFSSSSH